MQQASLHGIALQACKLPDRQQAGPACFSVSTVLFCHFCSELDLLLSAARRLGVRPSIGIRAKLTTRHAGHWGSTSGDKAKVRGCERVHCWGFIWGTEPAEVCLGMWCRSGTGLGDCSGSASQHVRFSVFPVLFRSLACAPARLWRQ